MKDQNFSKTPLAKGVALAIGATGLSTAVAQENAPMEEIVTVGIRSSLTSSMVQKRDAQGVSDGIIAEDIGKFPDTNLAESLQRITGVSIDRSDIGEGSRVTVRGVGPDFNLVTLNGRQMPGTRLFATTASGSRSFDFANLASEAVSAVQVYKTSQARLPTGGMGATINIKTARPFDNPDMVASFGVKAVTDTSVVNGDDVTPELSGIFSNTFADGKFGVAVTASYQDRNSGFNQAGAASGFQRFQGDQGGWGSIPQPGDPGSENIVNRPGANDVYSVPQNMLYSFNDVQRERTNGQLTLQFAPTETVTATLDYTYSEQEAQFQRAELSGWFNFGASASSWTDGPVAAPITYAEFIPAGNSDVGTGGAEFGAKSENTSVGFNLTWDPSDNLSFEFDYHNSEAELGKASPYGTNAVLGVVGFYRGDTGVILDQDFPVLTMDLGGGATGVDPSQTYISGSSFRNAFQLSEVEQARLGGTFYFDDDAYSLDFGVMSTVVNNRSAYSNVQNDTWGGAGSPDDFNDSDFTRDTVRGYFSNMQGSNNQNLFNEFLRWDFDSIIQQAGAADNGLGPERFRASDDFSTDRRSEEESTAAYIQFNASFDIGNAPANFAAGVRYEKTDVTSSALVPIATGILWTGNNEFVVQKGAPDFTTLKGDYDYTLPSLDFNVEVVEDVIIRASYSETIGRPGWDDIQGGQTLSDLIRIDGGNANQGDPGLLPLESTNYDLSFEWYYGSGSYASLSYFKKDIENYIAVTTITDTPFNLPHPGQGARFAEADAATGGTGDLTAIRQYIFTNYGNTPEVTITGTDVNGNFTGTILGIAGEDPASTFDIFVPSNQSSESLDGWELAVQHLFGDSGFGVSANYTAVNTDSKYDDTNLADQFVLEGISDSANLIVFFENDVFSTRIAYNWRDEFLSGRFDGNGNPNPNYTEEYGQFDANVSWNFNEDLTFFLEGINITDEYARIHGRGDNVALYVTNTGPRYMIGARYNFR